MATVRICPIFRPIETCKTHNGKIFIWSKSMLTPKTKICTPNNVYKHYKICCRSNNSNNQIHFDRMLCTADNLAFFLVTKLVYFLINCVVHFGDFKIEWEFFIAKLRHCMHLQISRIYWLPFYFSIQSIQIRIGTFSDSLHCFSRSNKRWATYAFYKVYQRHKQHK